MFKAMIQELVPPAQIIVTIVSIMEDHQFVQIMVVIINSLREPMVCVLHVRPTKQDVSQIQPVLIHIQLNVNNMEW